MRLVSKIVNTGRYLTRAEYIYHKSTSGSAIRRLIVDIAIYKWSEKDIAQVNPNPENMAFLHDSAVALKKLQKSDGRSTAPFEGDDACVYHRARCERPAVLQDDVSLARLNSIEAGVLDMVNEETDDLRMDWKKNGMLNGGHQLLSKDRKRCSTDRRGRERQYGNIIEDYDTLHTLCHDFRRYGK